jgi:4-aminobutyrate aminotransferase-like enzyme
MALASLEELGSNPVVSTVAARGETLLTALQQLAGDNPCFQYPRGRGLLAGIEVVNPQGRPDGQAAGRLIEAALASGLILLGGGIAGNVLSFTPPFGMTEEEIHWAVERIGKLAI